MQQFFLAQMNRSLLQLDSAHYETQHGDKKTIENVTAPRREKNKTLTGHSKLQQTALRLFHHHEHGSL